MNKPVNSQHAETIRVILLMDESIPQQQGWPELFFEQNYGSFEADPLNIPAELVYETNRLSVDCESLKSRLELPWNMMGEILQYEV